MMKPIAVPYKGDNIKILCTHWKAFPPTGSPKSSAELKKAGKFAKDHDYQFYVTWEKNCCKMKMDEACLQCPLVKKYYIERNMLYTSKLDGSNARPIVDSTTLESRRNSK